MQVLLRDIRRRMLFEEFLLEAKVEDADWCC